MLPIRPLHELQLNASHSDVSEDTVMLPICLLPSKQSFNDELELDCAVLRQMR